MFVGVLLTAALAAEPSEKNAPLIPPGAKLEKVWGDGDKGGVYVFSPEGKQLDFIATPEMPTNCVFGGKNRKTLYNTAGKSLYRIGLNTEGFAVYWPKED